MKHYHISEIPTPCPNVEGADNPRECSCCGQTLCGQGGGGLWACQNCADMMHSGEMIKRVNPYYIQLTKKIDKVLLLDEEPPSCQWAEDDDGAWDTECGRRFDINDGTPRDNHMLYCCFCGGRIVQIPYREPMGDGDD